MLLIASGQKPRKALPSASLGNWPTTTLLVSMRFHIGSKQPPNVSAPKKNIVVYLNGLGFFGSAWRPKYQDCQGTTVDRHGTPCASHVCATGFVVSGVDVVRTMSAPPSTSCWATCAAWFGSDWLSLTVKLT